jgi:hypothetical protein
MQAYDYWIQRYMVDREVDFEEEIMLHRVEGLLFQSYFFDEETKTFGRIEDPHQIQARLKRIKNRNNGRYTEQWLKVRIQVKHIMIFDLTD